MEEEEEEEEEGPLANTLMEAMTGTATTEDRGVGEKVEPSRSL